MARIRSIHPGLFTDEAFVSCSAFARLLTIGLWTEADDNGVFEWKALQLKMRLFPADAVDVGAMLDELATAGLVMAFEASSKRYGAIKNFCKFQRPRKPKAWFPLPDDARDFVALGCDSDEPDDVEGDRVPQKSVLDPVQASPVPPKSEKSPQMEDGGGRKKEEATASVADEPKPDAYPPDFDEAWRAYPHIKGRSSKPKALAEWRRIPTNARCSLAAATARYAREGREPRQDCGAPAMDRWLRDRRFEDFLPGPDPPAKPLTPEVLAGRMKHFTDTGEWKDHWGDRPA